MAGEPRYVPLAMADRITGLMAASAINAALVHQLRSGEGQLVEVPMFETMLNFVLGDHLGGKVFDPPLDGGGYGRLLSPDRKPYRTKDGFVCTMIYNDRQWRNFCAAVGWPDLVSTDPRFASHATRTVHIDAVLAMLAEEFLTRTTAEWMALLEAADLPVTPVHTLETIFEDPHLVATGFFERGGAPDRGPHHPHGGAGDILRHADRRALALAAARRRQRGDPGRGRLCRGGDRRADGQRRGARRVLRQGYRPTNHRHAAGVAAAETEARHAATFAMDGGPDPAAGQCPGAAGAATRAAPARGAGATGDPARRAARWRRAAAGRRRSRHPGPGAGAGTRDDACHPTARLPPAATRGCSPCPTGQCSFTRGSVRRVISAAERVERHLGMRRAAPAGASCRASGTSGRANKPSMNMLLPTMKPIRLPTVE